jgi:HlyD family secretion protein
VKTKWKVVILIVALLVIAGGVVGGIQYSKKGVVTVQTGKVVRQDLTSIVTASGEIKPRNYINIGANTMGPARIVGISVVEGQSVQRGQLLARLESVQPEAQVAAQRAQVSSSQAEVAAAESSLKASDENLRTVQASVDRAIAERERAKISFDRAKLLSEEKLIARSEFDQRKADFDAFSAGVREAEARQMQAQAQRAQLASQLAAAKKRVALADANLAQASDQLQRTYAKSPIDGVVTNLPVRTGETVVPGIQNSAASLIMTIADMSLITAEVKVDETDIVNVTLGQTGDITIDAIPEKVFKGKVIEIGNTAILRSTGLAASQSAVSSQEAKDFKVVIALDEPPAEIRPGLSCTAKVTTATRDQVLSIPIQALTIRQQGDLLKKAGDKDGESNEAEQLSEKERKKELQGVFVIDTEQAVFREVKTGITGATDIEVLDGLSDDQEIITGSYKVIRTIRNEAKVKVDNKKGGDSES